MSKIKMVKGSSIPIATTIAGFEAFGIKVNPDGTVDNTRVPMTLLQQQLTEQQILDIEDTIRRVGDDALSNYIGLEIDDDMNLIFTVPDNHTGYEFVLEDGILKVLV